MYSRVHQSGIALYIRMSQYIFFLIIGLVVANKNSDHFSRWKTNCMLTKEVQVKSRSRLQCAAFCGKCDYFDVFRYKNSECFCAHGNGSFVIGTSFIYNVYIREDTLKTWNFTSSCSQKLSTNKTLKLLRSPCRVDASIILFNRKLVLFTQNVVLFYDDYHDVDTGPTSTWYISDLFLGLVGSVDAAFNDDTFVHILQGLQLYVFPLSTIQVEIPAIFLQKKSLTSMFNFGTIHNTPTSIDCVIKHGGRFYFFVKNYIYDMNTNSPTAVEWKSNSANNPFKSINHTPNPHVVDACAAVDSQKVIFFSGLEHMYFEFTDKLGFWSERNQTMC